MNFVTNPCLPIPPRHVPVSILYFSLPCLKFLQIVSCYIALQTNFYEFPLQNLQAPILYRDFIQRLEEKKGIDTMKRINEHEEEVSRLAVSK